MSEPTEPPTPEAPSDDTPEETTPAPVTAGPPTTAAPAPPSEGKPPLTSVSDLGVASDKNARYRRVMEDAHVYVDGFGGDSTTGYFAVYDGHGGRGAVEYVRDHLHENLLQSLISHPHSVEAALKDSYAVTDSQIAEAKIQFSGTTTVSALLRVEQDGSKKLYVANVGDARAILNHGGKAIRLTFDHKGSDEGEVKRIQEAGGFVVMNRVNGILAVTRSLGDCAMKDYVSGEPYISTTVLTPEDTHLIIACDGVWDVITDDGALEIIAECENCTEAAKKLLIQSLKRGSTDNISVMVIKL